MERPALIADILDGAICGVLLNESYVAEARAYISALEKDAARYEGLRSRLTGPVPMVRIQIMRRGQYVLLKTPEELDAALAASEQKS